jgi:hypothetical protein
MPVLAADYYIQKSRSYEVRNNINMKMTCEEIWETENSAARTELSSSELYQLVIIYYQLEGI